MDKQTKGNSSENVGELSIAGISTILGLLGGVTASPIGIAAAGAGAIGSFALFAWQTDQVKKLINELTQKLEKIDQAKLDKSVISSDEFKELLIQSVLAASQSASELKREKLTSTAGLKLTNHL